MSGFQRFGRLFSRDCFLCLGVALLVIVFGNLGLGNMGILIAGHFNVAMPEVRELIIFNLVLAFFGTVLLVAGYSVLKAHRWSTYFAAATGAAALIVTFFVWSDEPIVQAFYGVPLFFVVAWALTEIRQASQLHNSAV